jgi:hypothetical protein
MFRKVAAKVAWVGRTACMVFGLALVMALLFGVATTALAGTGVGARFQLGQTNTVNAVSRLVGSVAGPSLQIDNNSTDASATALNLQVEPGRAPLTVDPAAGKATNLNADRIDGLSSEELAPRGYAQINHNGPALVPGSSKGVIDVVRTTANVYCFDLSFTPKTAVASANFNNNATVGTLILPATGCPAPYTDAAARTYGANDSSVHGDVSFGIVFM